MTSLPLHGRAATPPNRALSRNVADYACRVAMHRRYLRPVAAYFVRLSYQRTVLGFWWVVLRAILPAAVMSLVFPHVESLQTPGLPYSIFLLVGMTLWILVDIGITRGMRSLHLERRLRRFIDLPGFLVTLASLALPLIYCAALLLCTVLVVVVCAALGQPVPLAWRWQLLALPALFVLVLMLVAGLTAFLSVAYTLARDVRFIAPLLTQVWFFATPVFYPLSILPPAWQQASLFLNPLTSVMEAARFALFGVGQFPIVPLLVSLAVIGVIFIGGMWFMMRSEWVLPEMS